MCAKTRDLTREQAAYVDAAVAESADGRIPWSRFETLVEAKVAHAAPEAAREREEQAAKATFAKKLRTEAHGMATFMVRADVATIDAIDAAVTATRRHAGRDDARGQRRPAPGPRRPAHRPPRRHTDTDLADLLPTVQLYLHTYPGPDAEPIARLEGHGPVTEAWITRVLGPHAKFKIQPVLDLAGQAPVDAYEIPDRHRQAVHLITPADTFPFASSLSRKKQVDHTIPFDEGGVTGIGNYGPMTLFPPPPQDPWRMASSTALPRDLHLARPSRRVYLVDNTGTRRLRGATPRDLAA